jgi:multidrug transporter EmrE-like cation transporter
MNIYILALPIILVGCVLNTIGQIFLKKGMTCIGPLNLTGSHMFHAVCHAFKNWYIFGGFIAYGLSLSISLIALSRLPVSYFYPLSVSISYIFVTIASYFFLGDTISLMKVLGLATIILGVYIVAIN